MNFQINSLERREFENILGNLKISLGLRPREIFKLPRASSNSLRAAGIYVQIPSKKPNFLHKFWPSETVILTIFRVTKPVFWTFWKLVWSRSEVVWASFLALKAILSTLHPLLWGPAEALPREKPLGFDFLVKNKDCKRFSKLPENEGHSANKAIIDESRALGRRVSCFRSNC